MIGRRAEADHREPLALVSGGIAQVFAHQRGRLEIMMLHDERVAAREIPRLAEQAQLAMFDAELLAHAGTPELRFRFGHARRASTTDQNCPEKKYIFRAIK